MWLLQTTWQPRSNWQLLMIMLLLLLLYNHTDSTWCSMIVHRCSFRGQHGPTWIIIYNYQFSPWFSITVHVWIPKGSPFSSCAARPRCPALPTHSLHPPRPTRTTPLPSCGAHKKTRRCGQSHEKHVRRLQCCTMRCTEDLMRVVVSPKTCIDKRVVQFINYPLVWT